MARVLGYGGIANTNGARDFAGKAEAAATANQWRTLMGVGQALVLAVLGELVKRGTT